MGVPYSQELYLKKIKLITQYWRWKMTYEISKNISVFIILLKNVIFTKNIKHIWKKFNIKVFHLKTIGYRNNKHMKNILFENITADNKLLENNVPRHVVYPQSNFWMKYFLLFYFRSKYILFGRNTVLMYYVLFFGIKYFSAKIRFWWNTFVYFTNPQHVSSKSYNNYSYSYHLKYTYFLFERIMHTSSFRWYRSFSLRILT